MNNLFEKVCEIVCKGERVEFADIIDDRRNGELLYPRQLLMYFAKELKLGSLAEIAQPFGRDHATVINSCKSIKNYIDTDKHKQKQITEYYEKITGVKKVIGMIEVLKNEIENIDKDISEVGIKFVNLQLSLQNIKNQIENIQV